MSVSQLTPLNPLAQAHRYSPTTTDELTDDDCVQEALLPQGLLAHSSTSASQFPPFDLLLSEMVHADL
jgi:hypothetical protein